jgi:hypothetical protein
MQRGLLAILDDTPFLWREFRGAAVNGFLRDLDHSQGRIGLGQDFLMLWHRLGGMHTFGRVQQRLLQGSCGLNARASGGTLRFDALGGLAPV